MSDSRPDPDALLAQLKAQDATHRSGKLRIYFGASAGVGKTYAMLSAAQQALKAGRDVLVGVIETHGRADTAQQLLGLPQLPLRDVAYRGATLKEFDLDAALARQPAVLLVDELAHSNVEGSRHPKRWQDVQELLAAGIDVWSALNVQHLESLNGTVSTITGVRIHETVPDTLLDQADELILVDVTADELTARLKAGKVYKLPQAERAAQNFFRKGNLIALREIALRRTAEHVEDDVQSWRVEQSAPAAQGTASHTQNLPAWHTSGAILACVGPQGGAEQTVRTAARLAGQLNVRWQATYVETPRLQRLAIGERDRILAVLKLAEELGAATAVLAEDDVAVALAAQARQLNCATLVIGRSQMPAWQQWWPAAGVARRLAQLAPSLDIVQVGDAHSTRRLSLAGPRAQGTATDLHTDARVDATSDIAWAGYAWAVAGSVAITALATPLVDVLALANIVMLFLLGVVWVAVRHGRAPAALAAVLNVAAFDFFFVPPRLSFAVSDVQYLLTFTVMLVVGLLVGHLTAGLRFQARIAASRERRAQSLFELARDLSGALQAEQVAQLGQAAVQRNFGGQALVLVAHQSAGNDKLTLPAHPPEGFDASVADWTFRKNHSAGLATATLAAQPWHYSPLKAPMRVRGVLALQPAQPRWLLIPEQMQQLDTLARQVAIALERVHYLDIAQQAVVQMESDRLRNALLAAISHDVRTPLTALLGLAETLLQKQKLLKQYPQGQYSQARNADLALNQPESGDLSTTATVQAIATQARALNALVSNLLEMARLQSGAVNLRLDWQSVEELVGSAIRAAQPALGRYTVQTALPPDLPLVAFDAALMERVLVNLLENAVKYGAPPFVISAAVTANTLVITVRDHGIGLPAASQGQEDALFEKFTRGETESITPGVGLGLAICKAVVQAHKGSIAAADAASGKGAQFTITLPREEPPAVP